LAGANIIYGLGMLEMGMTWSLPQLLIDADIADMIQFSLNGISVTDETLSVDVTKEVGYKKDFLTHRHTFKNRHIQSNPKLIDRQMRVRWEEAGKTDMETRARALSAKVLENHKPTPLAPEALKAIHKLVNDTEAERGLPQSSPMNY
jgi:trimethylamine--corrinoid protein Co-methyltransferase